MSKHTPGPWKITKSNGDVYGTVDGRTKFVGQVDAYLTDRGKANARLIIEAPAMLSMLESVRDGAVDNEDDPTVVDITIPRETWNELLALITRAKGE